MSRIPVSVLVATVHGRGRVLTRVAAAAATDVLCMGDRVVRSRRSRTRFVDMTGLLSRDRGFLVRLIGHMGVHVEGDDAGCRGACGGFDDESC
jgi:hypothetical protein